MKQNSYESAHQARWQRVETALAELPKQRPPEFVAALPVEYRQLCYDFSIAKTRNYSPNLISRLNAMVTQMHHLLYRQRPRYRNQWIKFIVHDFPDTLKANSAFVGLAIALFFVPLLLMGLACYFNEEMIYTLMSWEQVAEFESAYDPSQPAIGDDRESDSDLMMFGYYIYNNIGIGFRTFASGILYCLGSIFFLVFNGLSIGGVAGHLTQLGYTETFYSFVAGHGSFELTAIAFSGAAGMKLGWALILPGPMSRLDALRLAARDAVIIMYGVGVMLFIAAFIEAFWSSSELISPVIKYAVGAALWFFVFQYCTSGQRVAEQTRGFR